MLPISEVVSGAPLIAGS